MPLTDDARLLIETERGTREARLGDFLSLDEIERADRDAIAWIKSLRTADLDGRPLRDALLYRGDSLWWFVEIYLHRMRVIETLFRAVTATENIFRVERPRAITLVDGDPIAQAVLRAGAARHATVYRGPSSGVWYDTVRLAGTIARGVVFVLRAIGSRLRRRARRVPEDRPAPAIAAFVHSAFWRSSADREAYVGPILKELVARVPTADIVFVGLGPATVFRARTVARHVKEWQEPPPDLLSIEGYAPLRALRGSLALSMRGGRLRRLLWRSADLRRAAVFSGYDLWRFVRHELAGVAYLQLPWSARAMDETGAALDALHPRLALTYAEAGGWGRALALEARRRGIPVCGLQHGFIHRHWLNYLHEPDEMVPTQGRPEVLGFPRPDLTLLFDRFVLDHLVAKGSFPRSALEVCGNPRLDNLAESAARQTDQTRQATRARLGVAPGARIVLLATKYRERAHAALEALFEAARALPGVHLVVRCHPAETSAAYERLTRGASTISISPADVDLVSSLSVADLVVTVNSTVALEAMALGVPALALNLPNYLSPFVDAGVMYGAGSPSEVARVCHQALSDEESRRLLRARTQGFVAEYELLPTGLAADRAVRAILALARAADR